MLIIISILVPAIFGIGVAIYIGRIIEKNMQKKPQRILNYLAITSLSVGFTGLFNQVFSHPALGLEINYNKVASHFIANILILPAFFYTISWSTGRLARTNDLITNNQNYTDNINYLKYLFTAICICLGAYFLYSIFNPNTDTPTYDFYERIDPKNCNSQYESKSDYSVKFTLKKETNEIFMTSEFNINGTKKIQIIKLENCSILDAKNWMCGGEWFGSLRSPKYINVNDNFSYESGTNVLPSHVQCESKIVKR